MKLSEIRVSGFRNIRTKSVVQIGTYTNLIGANNEGKSNHLKALNAICSAILWTREPDNRSLLAPMAGGSDGKTKGFLIPFALLDKKKDFPRPREGKSQISKSTIELDVEFSPIESGWIKELSKQPGVERATVRASADDSGYTAHVSVSTNISSYPKSPNDAASLLVLIAELFDFLYIPSARTAKKASDTLQQIVSTALAPLEANSRFKEALAELQQLQAPLMENMRTEIAATINRFVPSVVSINFNASIRSQTGGWQVTEAELDDGELTPISEKGDGIQSLVVIALLRYISLSPKRHRKLVLAIEEPETHLHPLALHELRDTLSNISAEHQVITSTHSPLLVRREPVSSNIIIRAGQAHAAASLEEIRATLGVRLSDNLTHAELILLVEGADDELVIRSLIGEKSGSLRHAMETGRLVIDEISGVNKLSYRLRGITVAAMCRAYVFIDDDDAAHQAFKTAEAEGLLTQAKLLSRELVGAKNPN
jgi:putative ATP-dependent endonuclease of OLD family